MLQDVLGEPEWADLLTPADRRALTRLFWSHVRPYGEVNLDMGARLKLSASVARPSNRCQRRQRALDGAATHAPVLTGLHFCLVHALTSIPRVRAGEASACGTWPR
ncbi:hypothetical protein ACFWPV_25595 [Streptomyces uncialis]|uniref:hypothetical protein n=1 Tax=Streptomyces uncialis TaxID=1048205 RepID=UPI00365A792E